MLDLSKPLQTRDGREAILMQTDSTFKIGTYAYPLVALVEHATESSGFVKTHFTKDGRWHHAKHFDPADLINVPEPPDDSTAQSDFETQRQDH